MLPNDLPRLVCDSLCLRVVRRCCCSSLTRWCTAIADVALRGRTCSRWWRSTLTWAKTLRSTCWNVKSRRCQIPSNRKARGIWYVASVSTSAARVCVSIAADALPCCVGVLSVEATDRVVLRVLASRNARNKTLTKLRSLQVQQTRPPSKKLSERGGDPFRRSETLRV